MDFVTQGILGAAVGQAGFSRKLGRRALGWGAIIGMLPDLDVIIILSSNPFAEVLYHRGVTHSLWFGPIIGPVLGYLLWRYYNRLDSLSSWIGLSIWALITHPLLDLFTVYGTQLLAPLSDHRFTLAAVPIIDPIYTGVLLLAVIFGCVFYRQILASIIAANVALLLTSCYLFYGLAQNDEAYVYAKKQLAADGLPNADVRVYTTMFQIFLRRIVVHFPNDVWIGYLTTWAPEKIIWHKQPQAPMPIRQLILNHPYGKIYNWFTSDELIIRPHMAEPNQWDLYDSRFGLWGNTILGIWGRTVTIDAKGIVNNDFIGFRVPVDISAKDFSQIWNVALGRSHQPK
jgi:inner membrane protein